jgi:streptogramin lyase
VEFSRNGTVLQHFSNLPSLSGPTDMVIDSSGNLLVTQNEGALQKFSSSGTYLGTIGGPGSGTGQLTSPWGVTLDPSGNIWVSSSDNNRIVEFNSSGSFLQQFGGSMGTGNGQMWGPGGLAIDSSGNVWVSDSGNNRIEGFSSTGAYLTQFGALGTGNGQFNNPSGLAMDPSGNIWVADMFNSRIEEFSPVPKPSTIVLLGIGAATLLAYAWRRAKAS